MCLQFIDSILWQGAVRKLFRNSELGCAMLPVQRQLLCCQIDAVQFVPLGQPCFCDHVAVWARIPPAAVCAGTKYYVELRKRYTLDSALRNPNNNPTLQQ